jgi:hypothetical protein
MVLVALMTWVIPTIRWRTAAFACGTLALVLLASLAGTGYVVLENRLYLAAVGMSLVFGEAIRAIRATWPRWDLPIFAVCGGAVVALALTTLNHSASYRDRQRFAQAAIIGSPHSGVAVNLLRRSSGVAMPPPSQ